MNQPGKDATIHMLPMSAGSESNDTLALISEARRHLAEAHTLPDIRRVMEAATVVADAAQRAAKLAEAQRMAAEVVEAPNDAANDAASVRIEAQAKAGVLLQEMSESGARDPGGRGSVESRPATQLRDLGVTKSESSRWQQVAKVPAEVRDEYVEETRAARGEVSTAGLLRRAAEVQPTRPTADRGTRRTVDHAAIAAEARKEARKVYRDLLTVPGFRPESLVAALDSNERSYLLGSLDQLVAWIEDVRKELAVYHVAGEE
jgi:hypothetical protein